MKDKELESPISFLSASSSMERSISWVGMKWSLLFDRYEVLPYLEENFEVLHTQGHQWLMEEIDEMINSKEVNL